MHRSLEQPQASPKATGILLFLLLLNILNMVDRTLITSFGTAIITDLGLSDSQFGLLTGPIFVFFYSIMGLFMGALADRVHRPRLIAAGLVLWSALTAVSGVAKNFAQIGVARLFIGVGESAMAPSAISMISDMFPKAKRGTATGIYYLGVPLGAGASFIVAGILGPMIGWRNCFLLLGGLGLVLALVLLFIKDPERGAMEEKGTEVDQQESLIGGNWRSIVSDVFQVVKSTPALAWTMVGAVFLHIPLGAGQFAIVWLERERGFGIGEISATYGLVYIIFGTAGTFLGGILSDWYQARYRGGRVRFLALLMMAVKNEVETGSELAGSMKETGVFPAMLIQMVSIGEQSGALDDMLSKAAEIYEEEVDTLVDGLTSMMEPLIMAFLGIIVGGLVVAMYLPIFQMGSVI